MDAQLAILSADKLSFPGIKGVTCVRQYLKRLLELGVVQHPKDRLEGVRF
jgi:hypothetical protein